MSDETTAKRTIYLSRSERRIGGRLFLRFSALNGLGISFLGDAAVTLLAIHFGAGNTELGIISAMLHISGVMLLLVPRMFKGRNVVSVAFWAWMMRGLVGIPYAALLFIEGKGAVALIMTLYALFCLSRTAGLAMVTTIQKRLMVSRTQNDMIFRNAMSFQGTQIASRLISYLVLSLKALAELTSLLILPVLGIIGNTAAALTLRRIPNRTRVDYQKGENLLVIFRRSMGKSGDRRILFLRWISLAQTILFAMAVPYLRRSVGLNAAEIFLYTIAISLAAFLSSISLRPIAARAGSRPVMFYTAIPAALFLFCWTFLPEEMSLTAYALAGFITMYALNASTLAANRLLISITPDDGAVGFNAMETFVTSILALLLGFGAGLLADVSEVVSHSLPINEYGFVFLPAAFGALFQVLIVLRVDEPGSMGLPRTAKLIGNVANLRIWQMVSNLEATSDPVKRKTLIHSVGHSRAPIASSEIGRILSEPLSQEKGELIEALFLTRRPELEGFLLEEAKEPAAFHRERAIFALGNYPSKATESTLKSLLADTDPRIRAASAKSLGRIGSKDALETVQGLWDSEWRLHQRLDLMIALYHIDPERRYIDDLFSASFTASGERSERTVYTLLSKQFGMSPPLGALYREEGAHKGSGLGLLLEEARDTAFLLEQGRTVEDRWFGGRYGEIWRLCQAALEETEAPETIRALHRALGKFPAESADAVNSLAGLYFTYQLLTSEAAT